MAQAQVAYWLGHCEGFRVEAAGRRLGLVEEVICGQARTPSALLVRIGLLGCQLALVPVAEVESIQPRRTRVILRVGEKDGSTPWLQRLFARRTGLARVGAGCCLIAGAAAALLLAGCGSSGADPPALPADLAAQLAARSEAVASSLDAGDLCRAAGQARTLRLAVARATAAGRVPDAVQGELRAAVSRLVGEIRCPPPAAPPEAAATGAPPASPDGNPGERSGEGVQGKGHWKGHGKPGKRGEEDE